jgi:ankyrin repeat protein
MGFISRFRLSAAIKAGKHDKVVALLAAGGDANESNSSGVTALMLAASSGYEDIIHVLIDHGAKVNAFDQNGFSALLHAIQGRNSEAVKALLDRSADATIETADGTTPHQLALKLQEVRIMKLLMAARASRES